MKVATLALLLAPLLTWIGGPAPRGLDLFNISEDAAGSIIVDTNPLNVLKRPNNEWDPAHVQVTDA